MAETDPYYRIYMRFYGRNVEGPLGPEKNPKAEIIDRPDVRRLEGPGYSPVEVGGRKTMYDKTGFK